MDLTMVNAYKDALQTKCDQLRMEKEDFAKRKKILKQVVHVYTKNLEVFVQENASLEEKIMNMSEAVHVISTNISNLEVCQKLRTQQEESEKREKRHKIVITTITNTSNLEAKCTNICV
jgi:hypothetical protein